MIQLSNSDKNTETNKVRKKYSFIIAQNHNTMVQNPKY